MDKKPKKHQKHKHIQEEVLTQEQYENDQRFLIARQFIIKNFEAKFGISNQKPSKVIVSGKKNAVIITVLYILYDGQ